MMVNKPLAWINCGERPSTRPSMTAPVMVKSASSIKTVYFFMCFPVRVKRQVYCMHNALKLLDLGGQ